MAQTFIVEGLDPEIAEWLAKYQPKGARRDAWPLVRVFVVSSIVSLRPLHRPTAESYAWALTGLAAWGLRHYLDVDPEILLHPDNVELFCTSGVKEGSQNTARSILRRIGPLLTRRAPWQRAPERLRHRTIAPPYSRTELDALRIDASRQSTPNRERLARSILSLGAGAGLDGRWSMKIRGTDVVLVGDVTVIDVCSPSPRVVPVLAAFEDELLELASTCGDDFLVGGEARSKNKASRALSRYEAGPGRPHLNSSRARSTWLLQHLILGTRLPELAQAAGFANVSSLDELLPYVPAMSELERRRMLRGPA
ncbi:MAG: hypothetical protein WEE66_07860 [Actinomycetota bacterium]